MKRWVALYLVSLAAAVLAANRFVRIPENQAIAWPNHDLIDVNHATAQDWMLLPGIGEKTCAGAGCPAKAKGVFERAGRADRGRRDFKGTGRADKAVFDV